MVTRLPGTFGNAYDAIGSTLSSAELVASADMQSGATAFEIASYVAGKVRATASAQARPAATASKAGRVSGGDRVEIADISASSRHCEEPTGPARLGRPDDWLRDEAIHSTTSG